jgi:small subunit ribosomal protein S8
MDLLSNATSIIKNGYNFRKQVVQVPNSKLCQGCLLILYKLGYIQNFTITNKKNITVFLKYTDNTPNIRNLTRISTPGRRTYSKAKKLKILFKNKDNGFIILSTSKGLLTDEEARLFNIGGELLLKVN